MEEVIERKSRREGRGALWLLAAGKSQEIMSRKRIRQRKPQDSQSVMIYDGFIGTDKVNRNNMMRRQKKISFGTVLHYTLEICAITYAFSYMFVFFSQCLMLSMHYYYYYLLKFTRRHIEGNRRCRLICVNMTQFISGTCSSTHCQLMAVCLHKFNFFHV